MVPNPEPKVGLTHAALIFKEKASINLLAFSPKTCRDQKILRNQFFFNTKAAYELTCIKKTGTVIKRV